MADVDFSTSPNVVTFGRTWPPKITIPDHAAEDENRSRLVFDIQTWRGIVSVMGYRKWECTGSVDALAAAGLLLPEWVPGLPGNNKTRQTVAFEDGVPRLVYGNRRGTAMPRPLIVIEKISRHKYCVMIDATKEQYDLLDAMGKRHSEKRSAARAKLEQSERDLERSRRDEEIMIRDKSKTVDEVRQQCIEFADIIQRAIMNTLNGSSYQPSTGMQQEMQGIFDGLKTCLQQGELWPEYIGHGNVVALRRADKK